MTDQSKYQIAIEAIRTKDYFGPEVERVIGINVQDEADVPFQNSSLLEKIAEAKLPCWGFVAFDTKNGPVAMGRDEENVCSDIGDPLSDHDPSPAKSLLIVMLMALEEMDKREAQS